MLNKIVQRKKLEVSKLKLEKPLHSLLKGLEKSNNQFSHRVHSTAWTLIAECKLASPAKGRLCTQYSVPELAKIYTDNGATALSVHTDKHFCGNIEDIKAVRNITGLPILRKDFIIDDYQIFEARAAGADAVLLIAAILTDEQLGEYLSITAELGMDALVEVHTQEEIKRVLTLPVKFLGINNRNLKTFVTDINNTFELLSYVNRDCVVISESGIKNGEDAARLQGAGVQGILVGEGLVKATDIGKMTREMALK